jgi:hypothetical protein
MTKPKPLEKFDERKKKNREFKFSVEVELYEVIKKLSEDYQISMSRLLRGLLRDAVKQALLKENQAEGILLTKINNENN